MTILAGMCASAAERWRDLVRARLAESEALCPGRGAVGPAFWDSRAAAFARAVPDPLPGDPFLRRTRAEVRRATTVLDVGCGPGRYALALAPRVRQVVALDWSGSMVAIVARRARQAGLANVVTVAGRFEEAEVPLADVSICSYVLPLVDDARGFLAKLDATTRQRCLVAMGAASADLVIDPLWRHFHGQARRPGPTWLDALDVLAEVGIRAEADVVEVPVRSRFRDLSHAVRAYRDSLALPATPAVRRQLRRLLSAWLVPAGDQLRPPLRSLPMAVIHWAPRRRDLARPG